jgi:hypothetical protein
MVDLRGDREERERRRHIQQWARLMIVHLEGTDEAGYYSYTEALTRLRDLVDAELGRATSENRG